MDKIKKRETIITALIFAVILFIRLIHINNMPPEIGDTWRQADTESIARNFVQHRFNIFYPQFNYDGPLPNYVQLEFQITTFIIAALYKTFGYHIFLARIVPTALFMISVYYLFRLIKDIYEVKLAWIVIFIYSTIPINIFYSRAIMPESAVLCFFMGAFYYFYRWYKEEKLSQLLLSAVFTALAISQKTPAVFIGIAMILMCVEKYKASFLKKWELWLFGIIALAPPIIYTKWTESIAEFKFISGIGAKHIIPKFASAFFTSEAYNFYKDALPRSFTALVLILAVLGILTMREKKERPLIYLAIAVTIEVILIVSVIKFRYYLILLTPVIAILSGKALYSVFSKFKAGNIFISIILLLTLYNSYRTVKGDFVVADSIIEFGQVVEANTEEEDVIVIGTFDPTRLSIMDRQGWRANIKLYDYIPDDIEGELAYFKENGAKYFVVKDDFIHDNNRAYIEYLEENFKKIEIEDGYKFYDFDSYSKTKRVVPST